MRRIGLLTYYWTENPGTIMQAFCTYNALRRHFPDDPIELVNYRSWRYWWRPNLSYITPRQWGRDTVRMLKYRKARKSLLPFGRQSLVTTDYERSQAFLREQDYDVLVVGSDTLLELHRFGPDTVTAYWLAPDIRARKVMCAASARSTSLGDLSEFQRRTLEASVRGFDLLGVRDSATYELIRGLGGQPDKIEIVPDPTFTYDIDYGPAETYLRKKRLSFERPTVILHMTRQFTWAADLADAYRARGYQVVSLRPARYADYICNDISPLEWAGLFRGAKLVITHRFHDTLFCLKNLTPLLTVLPRVSYETSGGHSKYDGLLKMFGMSETHLIRDHSGATVRQILDAGERSMGTHNPQVIRRGLARYQGQYEGFIHKAAALSTSEPVKAAGMHPARTEQYIE